MFKKNNVCDISSETFVHSPIKVSKTKKDTSTHTQKTRNSKKKSN